MTNDNSELSPPLPTFARSAGEETTLVEMLDYYRAVLARKGSGLVAEQLDTALAPSDLTLGGLIYHMALVEDSWFFGILQGNEAPEPWASVDWEADFDWELNNADKLTPDELFAQLEVSVARSRQAFGWADSLDQIAAKTRDDGGQWNLRWIMVHMIEEYARHCGHADLIRQSIDGVTDD